MAGGYLSDVVPNEAWDILASGARAALVDVRTAAEWTFVGLPDLASLGTEVVRVEWQDFPAMQRNADFVASTDRALRQAGVGTDDPVFFLCRSGARSAAAAAAMTAFGYRRCFNIAGGFEGGRDAAGHRGTTEGWKAAGLPWVQS